MIFFSMSSSLLCRTLLHNSDVPWGPTALCRKEFDSCGEVPADEKCSMFWAIILSCISLPSVSTFVVILIGVLSQILDSWACESFLEVVVYFTPCCSYLFVLHKDLIYQGCFWCLSCLLPCLIVVSVPPPWFFLVSLWLSWGVLLVRYGSENLGVLCMR